jgi:hypothetical protein
LCIDVRKLLAKIENDWPFGDDLPQDADEVSSTFLEVIAREAVKPKAVASLRIELDHQRAIIATVAWARHGNPAAAKIAAKRFGEFDDIH